MRLFALIFVVFCLCNYTYLFFFDFFQGESGAPIWLKGAKDVVQVVFVAGVVTAIRSQFIRFNILMSFFLLMLLQLIFGLVSGTESIELLIAIKNLLLGISAGYCVYILSRDRPLLATSIWKCLCYLMLGQVIFNYILLFVAPELELWIQSNASGLIGNPNTYALFLNLGIASTFILPLKRAWHQALAFFIFGAGILLSSSLSGFLVMLVLFGVMTVLNRLMALKVVTTLMALVLLGISLHAFRPNVFLFQVHLQFFSKLGLGFALPSSIELGEESLSFSGRKVQLDDGIRILSEGHNFLFGNLKNGSYEVFDSQYLQVAVNHGIPMLLCFFAISLVCLFGAIRARNTNIGYVFFLATIAFGATQMFSHIWDYFPANVFLWFVYFTVVSNVQKAIQAERGSDLVTIPSPNHKQTNNRTSESSNVV